MILKTIKRKFSAAIKERIMQHYLIPYSDSGLDPGVVAFLKSSAPINLVDIGASSGEFAQAVENYCGIRHAGSLNRNPRELLNW
jgi:hypothetical protein